MTALPDNDSQEGHDGRGVEGFPLCLLLPLCGSLSALRVLKVTSLSSLPPTGRVPRL